LICASVFICDSLGGWDEDDASMQTTCLDHALSSVGLRQLEFLVDRNRKGSLDMQFEDCLHVCTRRAAAAWQSDPLSRLQGSH
jgi:hypothetical protein